MEGDNTTTIIIIIIIITTTTYTATITITITIITTATTTAATTTATAIITLLLILPLPSLILILLQPTPKHVLLGTWSGQSNQTTVTDQSSSTTIDPNRLDVRCHFFRCENADMKEGFYQHPYVPVKFHNKKDNADGIIIT